MKIERIIVDGTKKKRNDLTLLFKKKSQRIIEKNNSHGQFPCLLD